MKIELQGKLAIVTGSTLGIGLATAKGLAACGAKVVVNGRTQAKVDKAVAAIGAAVPGAQLLGVAADLASAEGCDKLVAAVPACDILVNNAGIFAPQEFFDTPDSQWQHFFDVNVMSGMRLSRAYLPAMAAKGWGRVVFLGSESALNIPEDMIHYGMTKTAVLALSRGLAKRMRESGVTVNAVLPGPTLSEGVEAMLAEEVAHSGKSIEEVGRDFVKVLRPSSIIGRLASCEEVANLIVYTCSEQASATTGAALRVDGGVVDSLV
ncbi:SDR family NAD(P)-dependent oxidoreductase [Gallaecimonas xiamenensis]|uniref:Short-chain dehydrogenase/reductase SDR n=1 Tax=Gallaecimonas xiamenensis 3-C-1 TaxID=745411 RepID=K2JXF7_9GAMM|nr:SDR family oxidoreductase [Gallaecimonas xiamenensis]EKE74994.1 short-chain dehydrogenase/reductase SDR [Gallaecimonas xiamenensis 3-C-1]